jgi:hypothetical protein
MHFLLIEKRKVNKEGKKLSAAKERRGTCAYNRFGKKAVVSFLAEMRVKFVDRRKSVMKSKSVIVR